MTISLRVLLGYFLIVGLAGFFVLNVFIEEVKPGVRQAMEETLIDSAQILAELAAPELKAGGIGNGNFARAVHKATDREFDAKIWGISKNSLEARIYVTDHKGIVVFDSEESDVGKDFSRWNDVRLTLQGKYGARTSRSDPKDESSSIMHVAAPILDDGKLLGVLTVAKPNASVQPFIERGQKKIRNRGIVLLGAAAAIGLVFTAWLTRSINRLRRYARDVADGKKTPLPESGHSEIAELGRALAAMREKLEGKQYVEQYVHTLTHEMKSPVAAIQGAAELLDEEMPRPARSTFIANIREQCERLSRICERMLNLAQVEQQQTLEAPQPVALDVLLNEIAASLRPRLEMAHIQLDMQLTSHADVPGDAFMLRQAINNLFENAIEFSPPDSRIEVHLERTDETVCLHLRDHGAGIPDYARERVFERFYSLPRPASGKKSTGLGLPFVREVAALHGGSIRLDNHSEGGGRSLVLSQNIVASPDFILASHRLHRGRIRCLSCSTHPIRGDKHDTHSPLLSHHSPRRHRLCLCRALSDPFLPDPADWRMERTVPQPNAGKT